MAFHDDDDHECRSRRCCASWLGIVAGVVVVVGVGCRTPAPSRPEPLISVSTVDAVDARGAVEAGANCKGRIESATGSRPIESRLIATATVSADRPVPLGTLEQMALVEAARRCADGVAIVRAATSDGAEGFVEAVAELWAVPEAAHDEMPLSPLSAPKLPASGRVADDAVVEVGSAPQ